MADAPIATPIVSVVIPTYRSGEGLDRAIAALDAQTMPQDRIEVLLLDDGSPDDTAARNAAIADARPNYRAIALEASGWPSRPRNVGVREAQGTWVLFHDHDDEVYPDGLRAAVALGERGDADVVNGKEVRTHIARWGLAHYTSDSRDARDWPLRGLLPMTPHKLYRRSYLLDHDIRFPEGPRHLWEDLFFHVDVLRHDPTVAVLSSTPFYHWRRTTENNSTATDGTRLDYSGDPEYWPYLDKLFAHVASLPEGALRDELLVQNVQVRLVSQIGHRYAEGGAPAPVDDLDRDRAEVARLLDAYVPPALDARLSRRSRTAITLFRAGYVDEAADFLRDGLDRRPRYDVTSIVDTHDGAVRLTGTVTWPSASGAPFARRTDDGRVERALPTPLRDLLVRLDLPVEPDLATATVDLAVRHGPTRVNWRLATTSTVALVEQEDGSLEPVGEFTARLAPATAAMGGPLAHGGHMVLGMSDLEDRTGIKRAFSPLPDGERIGPVVVDHSAEDGLILRVPPPHAAPEPSPARRSLLARLRRH